MRRYFNEPMRFWWWLWKPLYFWVRSRVSPEDPRHDLGLDLAKPILYVLPKRSLVDLLVLFYHCRQAGLPIPRSALGELQRGGQASYLYIAKTGIFQRERNPEPPGPLIKLIQRHQSHPEADLQLVPVSILWGKNPGREEASLFKLLFNDDENAGMLQKFLIVLAQGRNVLVNIGRPISLREQVSEGEPADQIARKLRRVLRVHFRRQRNTILGQRLYDREQVVRRIAKAKPVQIAIDDEYRKKKIGRQKAEGRARRYAREIAAEQTYSAIRFFEILLGKLWNRIYDGVVTRNFDVPRRLAENYELVYVPTHRSHLDYLLVNYTIYQSGLPAPHTAAGINLNFWPIGGLLRRAGGFFLRRSFGGNRLYTAVFNEYLHFLLTHNYPVCFFPEGGRSRTGRVLAPKTGMLAMVVQSFLRNHDRPIALVPVYIGYDKVVEVRSYLKELSGSTKRKESFFQLFQARKMLKRYYGKAYMGVAEPILLDSYLDERADGWRELKDTAEAKPPWLTGVVHDLAKTIVTRVNEATVVSPVSLIALALLSTPQKAMAEEDLIAFIEAMVELQKRFPYHGQTELPEGHFRQHLEVAEQLQAFHRFRHVGGDVLHLSELDAILMSYYKNNILHLFALPSLVARFFQHRRELRVEELLAGCRELYPFIKDEFFLRWETEQLDAAVRTLCSAMADQGLLIRKEGDIYQRPDSTTPQAAFLGTLGGALGLVFERYTITAALLARNLGRGYVESAEIEQQCQKLAQRLAILNGINHPDTADKSLFKNHIGLLKRMGYLKQDGDSRLVIDARIQDVAARSQLLLSPDIRHSIERITALTQ